MVKQIHNCDDLLKILQTCTSKRKVSKTNYNKNSSRSHSLLRITINSTNSYLAIKRTSHIDLVDLAGSETTTKAGLDKIHETKSINKSLFALTTAIRILSKNPHKKSHKRSQSETPFVQYRNSTLTKLLKNSISGSSKLLIICTLSPHVCDNSENKNTISFANNAKVVDIAPTINQNIINSSPKINQHKKWKEEIKRYELEIDNLKKQLQVGVKKRLSKNALFYKLEMIKANRNLLIEN